MASNRLCGQSRDRRFSARARVAPALGRNFRPGGEDRPGRNARVAIVSHGFWQRRLGGTRNVVGTTLTLKTGRATHCRRPASNIRVGRARSGAARSAGPGSVAGARATTAARIGGSLETRRNAARRDAELQKIAAELAVQFPESNGAGRCASAASTTGWCRRRAARRWQSSPGRCARAADRVRQRGQPVAGPRRRRKKEMSIRAALGAGRSRIMRQLVVEALLLSIAAGMIGVAIAKGATRLLGPRSGCAAAARRVVHRRPRAGLRACVSLITGLLFGCSSATGVASQSDRNAQGRAAGAGGGTRRQRLRNALVVCEVALSVALLIGAGLLVRSFWRLQHVDPGFDTSRLLTMRLTLPGLHYRTGDVKWAFYSRRSR